MPLQVQELTSKSELVAIAPLCRTAFATPLNSWWEIVKGPSADEMVERYWTQHLGTPGSHWIKVVDTETGEPLGAAEWVVHKTNPYETAKPLPQAVWWEDANIRNIGDQFLTTFFSERAKRMNKPHVLLRLCCTLPTARRRGVGSAIMSWGCALADDLGLESFIEATQVGVHLYSTFGFVPVGHFYLTAENAEATEDWRREYARTAPVPFRVEVMWMPAKGSRLGSMEADTIEISGEEGKGTRADISRAKRSSLDLE